MIFKTGKIDALDILTLVLYFASLIHVFIQSRRLHDAPIRHTLMVALVIWPISYLCWILWWPGSLRHMFAKMLFGTEHKRPGFHITKSVSSKKETGTENRI